MSFRTVRNRLVALVLLGLVVPVAIPTIGSEQGDPFTSSNVDLGENTGWREHRKSSILSIADGSLRDLADRAAKGIPLATDLPVSGDRALVDIHHGLSIAAIGQTLAGLGATVYRHLDDGFVEAFVPIDRLVQLQRVEGVASVSPPPRIVLLQSPSADGHVIPLATTVVGEEVA
ncbi:MAG: hypothetical protein ACRDWH_03705, partial [Acidimicrobiia bacterium]